LQDGHDLPSHEMTLNSASQIADEVPNTIKSMKDTLKLKICTHKFVTK